MRFPALSASLKLLARRWASCCVKLSSCAVLAPSLSDTSSAVALLSDHAMPVPDVRPDEQMNDWRKFPPLPHVTETEIPTMESATV
jgi:hypothetical protein